MGSTTGGRSVRRTRSPAGGGAAHPPATAPIAFHRVAQRLFETPLLIMPSKLDVILEIVAPRMGLTIEPSLLAQAGPSTSHRGYYDILEGGIALIPVCGTLVQRAGAMDPDSGFRSYETIRRDFEAAMDDPAVLQVLFDVDSPGGEVNGMEACAQYIASRRGEKPIVAFANEWACSAAYGISSAADLIILPRSGMLGSVGVIAAHLDQSKFDEKVGVKVTTVFAGARKNDFNPHEPLSDEALAELQAEVDAYYADFVELVAGHRGTTAAAIQATEAGVFKGDDAVAVGLADAVLSFDEVLAQMGDGTLTAEVTRNQSARSRGAIGGRTMKTPTKPAPAAATEQTTGAEAGKPANETAGATGAEGGDGDGSGEGEEEPKPGKGAAATASNVVSITEARAQEIAKGERQRLAALTRVFRAISGKHPSLAAQIGELEAKAVEEGMPVEKASAALVDLLASSGSEEVSGAIPPLPAKQASAIDVNAIYAKLNSRRAG